MRWIVRSLLTLAFLGLATLAVLPHTDTIRSEWQHLRKAWELVRNGESPSTTEPSAPDEPAITTANRGRTVVKPTESDAPTTIPTTTEDDPFLAEARRRASADPAAAMDWLQSEATGQDRLRGMLEVVALWAANDSESALLWLESNAQGLIRMEALSTGMELWSQQDPIAAATWIDGMANDGSKVTAAKTLAANWATQSPVDASQWVEQLPYGSLRNEASAALVEAWISTDPEAASIWALTQAEFQGNKELLNQSIQHYAQISPENAEAFVRSVNEAYEAPEATAAFVRTLAQSDPTQAMQWQADLSPDDLIYDPKNSEIIMQEWSRSDSVAASTWLNDATPGPQRDAAIVGFTSTMLDFDPEAAAAWSNTISEPKQRIEQLNRSILSWAHTQPHEALQWVKDAELEPDLRHALASQIGAD